MAAYITVETIETLCDLPKTTTHIMIDFNCYIDVGMIPECCTHLKFRKDYSFLLSFATFPRTVTSIMYI